MLCSCQTARNNGRICHCFRIKCLTGSILVRHLTRTPIDVLRVCHVIDMITLVEVGLLRDSPCLSAVNTHEAVSSFEYRLQAAHIVVVVSKQRYRTPGTIFPLGRLRRRKFTRNIVCKRSLRGGSAFQPVNGPLLDLLPQAVVRGHLEAVRLNCGI